MEQEQQIVLAMLEAGKLTPNEANDLLDALEENSGEENRSVSVAAKTERHVPPQPAAMGKGFSTDQIVKMARYGVSPAEIRDMRSTSVDLSFDQVLELAMHGVSPDYVREMAALGLEGLSFEKIKKLGMHGVEPDTVRDFIGFQSDLGFEQILRLAMHGVDPGYIAEMQAQGFELSFEELLKMGRHGITPDFVRELKEHGFSDLSAKDIVKFAMFGVDVDFIREIRDLEAEEFRRRTTGQKVSGSLEAIEKKMALSERAIDEFEGEMLAAEEEHRETVRERPEEERG
jgi:hypothetical protein